MVSNFRSDGPAFNVTVVSFHWTKNFGPIICFLSQRGRLAPSVSASLLVCATVISLIRVKSGILDNISNLLPIPYSCFVFQSSNFLTVFAFIKPRCFKSYGESVRISMSHKRTQQKGFQTILTFTPC